MAMQTSVTGKHNSAAGFSLLELVVVLCVLSVMTGLLAPRIFVKLQGKAPALVMLEKALQEARTKALVTGEMHVLAVDLKEGRFAPVSNGVLANAKAILRSDKAQSLPPEISFVGLSQHGETLERLTYAEIRVRPDGLAEPVRIRLQSEQDKKKCTAVVTPSTAKLVLIEGEAL